jgi:hypothetical protein
MLIDKLSGSLTAGEEMFPRHMVIAEFKRTKAGSGSKLGVENGPWKSYQVRFLNEAACAFMFHDQRLYQISMAITGESNESWDTWTEEKELERRRTHDNFLRNALGIAPYVYAWGEVVSVLDEKSGGASIIVRYSGC